MATITLYQRDAVVGQKGDGATVLLSKVSLRKLECLAVHLEGFLAPCVASDFYMRMDKKHIV
jgi:hypothetical protein